MFFMVAYTQSTCCLDDFTWLLLLKINSLHNCINPYAILDLLRLKKRGKFVFFLNAKQQQIFCSELGKQHDEVSLANSS